MITLSTLLSPCFLFGHDESLKDFKRDAKGTITLPQTLITRCPRCHQELGVVLKGLKKKYRAEATVVRGSFQRRRVG